MKKPATFDGRVLRLLREGYGAEDVALKLKCDPEMVRRSITRLREQGYLRKMWETKP